MKRLQKLFSWSMGYRWTDALRNGIGKIAVADCVLMHSGKWYTISFLLGILKTIFWCEIKSLKEFTWNLQTGYLVQLLLFRDGSGILYWLQTECWIWEMGENRLLILTLWFTSFVNLDELPNFPKLHFPHLQNNNEGVVVRVRKTMHAVLSLVAGIW